MGRPSPAVPDHKVKVTMDKDFNVKEDDMEFYAQPYLFKPKYSDQEHTWAYNGEWGHFSVCLIQKAGLELFILLSFLIWLSVGNRNVLWKIKCLILSDLTFRRPEGKLLIANILNFITSFCVFRRCCQCVLRKRTSSRTSPMCYRIQTWLYGWRSEIIWQEPRSCLPASLTTSLPQETTRRQLKWPLMLQRWVGAEYSCNMMFNNNITL